jgi:hypothetical protein
MVYDMIDKLGMKHFLNVSMFIPVYMNIVILLMYSIFCQLRLLSQLNYLIAY